MFLKRMVGSEQQMLDVRYLIKFVSKEAHADDLLDGWLHMNAAGYYAALEKGQGDDREGAIANLAIFRNVDHPVYCMYAVDGNAISNGILSVDDSVIDDFNCSDGFAVIIPFPEFEQRLSSLETNGHSLEAGLVHYGSVAYEDAPKLLQMAPNTPLFIKRSEYKHQSEYRIVVDESLPRNTHVGVLNGEEAVFLDTVKPYDAKRFRFPESLKSIAVKVPINQLEHNASSYRIDLRALGFSIIES